MNIKNLTIEQLKAGIQRCQARSDGTIPHRVITKQQNLDALQEYREELEIRGQSEIIFDHGANTNG